MKNNNFNNGAANNNSNNNGGFIMSTGTINTVDLFAEVVKAGLEEAHPECSVMGHKVTKNNNLVLRSSFVIAYLNSPRKLLFHSLLSFRVTKISLHALLPD